MMEIVIKIPEEDYTTLLSYADVIRKRKRKTLEEAVIKGTLIPEHHGDLIDRDAIEVLRIGNIKREYDKGFDAGVSCMVNRILETPTIIEAEGSEGE